MRKLFLLLGELLKNGDDVVVVSVVASSGSTPRGVGAHMLVTSKGRQCGTIGGGAVEFESEKRALEVLKSKSSYIEKFKLHENQVQDLGMICGGEAFVYFNYIPAGDESIINMTEKIEELFRNNEQAWLISEITPGRNGAISVYGKESGLFGNEVPNEVFDCPGTKAVQIEAGERVFFREMLARAGKVYIFGGGHVSQALVPVLTAVCFQCVVLEDREDFCRAELFPGASEARLIDNSRISEYVNIKKDDYVVIVTRGHKDDQTILTQALNTPARYIGVIGSKRKSEKVFANLREMGFTDSQLSRVAAPIGLYIKAETPEEIAVSIAGQLIQVRAGD